MGRDMFEKGEFLKLKFNVYAVAQGKDLLQKFPLLSKIKSFTDYAEADRNRIIRYIIYMYDVESPFIKRFQKIEDRQREAAILSGFDVNKHKDRLRDLYSNKDESTNDMIVDFIVELNNRKWAMIVSNEAIFYEFQRALRKPITNTRDDKNKMDAIMVKSKMMEESNTIDQRLDGYYEDLFGTKDLVEYGKRKRISPETQASK
jgi:hypothetical protein